MKTRMSGSVATRLGRASVKRALQCRAFSRYAGVEMGPKDPILGVQEAFVADPNPEKLSFGVGAYRDDAGKPVVLPSVAKAVSMISPNEYNEYAPIGGDPEFVKLALELAYGDRDQSDIVGLQSLSGTGSLLLIAKFLGTFGTNYGKPTVYVPDPTWGNHFPIFRQQGLTVETYSYYKPETRGLDFDGLISDFKEMKNGSAVLLHAVAHNPTGVDPTQEQWNEISALCKEKDFLVIFDSAYQGFASGSFTQDNYAVTKFIEDGQKIILAQSFAKNFGLYGHRIGAVSWMCEDVEEKKRVESQIKILARAAYSNPPVQGARIVKNILGDPALKEEWFADVKGMADRINSMRVALVQGLADAGSPHSWKHITDQIGMFAFSGMNAAQVERLANEFSIYMTKNGRISMAGVTTKNVGRLANAMNEVTKDGF